MNDLISSNGKTAKNKELGITKSTIPKPIWPTPEQLARKARHETVPVAFRIEEVSYACLDLLTKQYNMSMSAFVNEILNSYIEQNKDKIDGWIFNRTLNLYMERLASKMLHTKPSDMIKQFRMFDLEFIYEAIYGRKLPRDKRFIDEVLVDFYEHVIDDGWSQILNSGTGFFDVCLSIVKNDEKASTLDIRDWKIEDQNHYAFNNYVLFIPASKWPIVATLLESFYLKSRQLFDDNWRKEHFLNLEKVEKLAAIINENDDKDLIDSLARYLRLTENLFDKSGGF